MTTYILHGGKTSTQNALNDEFFKKFTSFVDTDSVTVLLCYFSREKEKWAELSHRDTNSINKMTSKKVKVLVADNPKDLLVKMDKSDVLYIAGGDAEPIEVLYPELSDLQHKIDGKIIAGSSMGMFFIAEHYVLSFDSQDSRTVHKGLGLLSIQALCHWDKEEEKEFKLQLLSNNSDKPIVILNEFESVVFCQ